MKVRMFFRVLVSLVVFSTSLAYGAKPTINLVGLWERAVDVAKADNDASTYTFFEPDISEYEYFVVTSHQQNLFKGYACTDDPDIERSYFSGVMNDNNIWITSWDSISIGTIDRTGTEMSFVNMHQSLDEGENVPSVNKSATSSGVATKLLQEITLPADPPTNCPPE